MIFFFQAEDGIRDLVRSRGLGDVYKRQKLEYAEAEKWYMESKTIQEKILGKESPEYARLLLSLIHI